MSDPVRPVVLSDGEWEWAAARIPILCVDFIPKFEDSYGLILRETPFPDRPRLWCHLGGRVRRDESLTEALHRHAAETIPGLEFALPANPQPRAVMQWTTVPGRLDPDSEWTGLDPRKHAVSLCYLIAVDAMPDVHPIGEALDYQWFRWDALESMQTQLWPGTEHMLKKLAE